MLLPLALSSCFFSYLQIPRILSHLFQFLRLTILQLTMKVQISFAILALEQRLFDSFFLALWLIVELDAELLLRHVRFSL